MPSVPAGGFPKLMRAFDLERCGNATMALGQAAAALDDALVWVQERRQFGKPIVEFQAVQLKLADMATKIHAARLLTYDTAAKMDAGERMDLEAGMAVTIEPGFYQVPAILEDEERMAVFGSEGKNVSC